MKMEFVILRYCISFKMDLLRELMSNEPLTRQGTGNREQGTVSIIYHNYCRRTINKLRRIKLAFLLVLNNNSNAYLLPFASCLPPPVNLDAN